ncbi:Uncharacterised protein [Legionella beliardensis]|uniref:Coiled coil protein n=1 Tax=Legionella beliardensis TaxID=91822 RepID=A0A378I3G8_9GAMM|nr:hypothetical protein [Legionella beliardensis]STX29708.1 Uncharacterised protein [Legionella beliardensis]
MPFFPGWTHAQIRDFCQSKSFEYLKNLNKKFGNLFEQMDDILTKNNNEIEQITQQITNLREQIKENDLALAQAEDNRNNVLSNAPGNGPERYLALQAVSYVPEDKTIDYKKDIEKLEKEKRSLIASNGLIQGEIRDNIGKLRIVNAVMEAKRPYTPTEELNLSKHGNLNQI